MLCDPRQHVHVNWSSDAEVTQWRRPLGHIHPLSRVHFSRKKNVTPNELAHVQATSRRRSKASPTQTGLVTLLRIDLSQGSYF